MCRPVSEGLDGCELEIAVAVYKISVLRQLRERLMAACIDGSSWLIEVLTSKL